MITALNTKKPGYLQLIVGDLVTVTQKVRVCVLSVMFLRRRLQPVLSRARAADHLALRVVTTVGFIAGGERLLHRHSGQEPDGGDLPWSPCPVRWPMTQQKTTLRAKLKRGAGRARASAVDPNHQNPPAPLSFRTIGRTSCGRQRQQHIQRPRRSIE